MLAGDEYVDWVGMNMYHFGQSGPWGTNVLPEDRKLGSRLTGTYNGPSGHCIGLPNFYGTYAEGKRLPMAICETAALYNVNATGNHMEATEQRIKEKWIEQVCIVLHRLHSPRTDVQMHVTSYTGHMLYNFPAGAPVSL